MDDHFNKIKSNRVKVSKTSSRSQWSKLSDNTDPIEKWKIARDRGDVKPLGYEAEPSKSDSKFGFNVIIPLNPMGIPKYDNGERFDLRLPYAERGYEDPSADVMGNMWRGIKNMFNTTRNGKLGK